MDNWFEEADFGDWYVTEEGEDLLFLAEKDGIYFCVLRGYWESIPYDASGKCLLTEVNGVDVNDGRMDIWSRRLHPSTLDGTITVGALQVAIDEMKEKDPEGYLNDNVIINDDFVPVCLSTAGDGWLCITASRLSPNTYVEEQKKKGKYWRF